MRQMALELSYQNIIIIRDMIPHAHKADSLEGNSTMSNQKSMDSVKKMNTTKREVLINSTGAQVLLRKCTVPVNEHCTAASRMSKMTSSSPCFTNFRNEFSIVLMAKVQSISTLLFETQ